MKKYIYKGPVSGVTLSNGTEIMLFPDKEVELEENEFVQSLIANGYLVPAEEKWEKTKKDKKEVINAS